MDDETRARRTRWVQELILSDERLRGGLTDEQFAQVLAWALPQAEALVAATAAIADDTTAEAVLSEQVRELRRAIQAAVRQAEAARGALLAPPPEQAPEQ
ncbi:MAG: hypothetical protein KatS3mg061_2917 [Dehalococcoidia bacterium]|nr:MAG: hypothetical protein KatS3mg061_2917 [Dehalococcoidia bacterium]